MRKLEGRGFRNLTLKLMFDIRAAGWWTEKPCRGPLGLQPLDHRDAQASRYRSFLRSGALRPRLADSRDSS
jgi:hypothetical protein